MGGYSEILNNSIKHNTMKECKCGKDFLECECQMEDNSTGSCTTNDPNCESCDG